jgi:preprotein translocase subunit SecA
LASALASELKEGEHYTREDKRQRIELLPATDTLVEEKASELDSVYRGSGWLRELVVKALVAQLYYHKDKHYVIQESRVIIVDDFTGRLMEGRSWKQGLHQAIEAKEGVPITDPTESMASLSFQRFFNFFRQISGITGTARESALEFWQTYNLSFIRIPVHKPCQRIEQRPRIFLTMEEKWDAIVQEIVAFQKLDRPILVGSRSIRDSEHLAKLLQDKEISYRLLNARSESEEAMIIARAGQEGVVTIATNMAGRGTDIKLARNVPDLGGLHVISTEMNESRRIDRQLFGRAGRQGDPGSSILFASFEDELIQKHYSYTLRNLTLFYVKKRLPGSRWLAVKVFQQAQKNASRQAFRRRQAVMKQDRWLEEMFALNSLDFGK